VLLWLYVSDSCLALCRGLVALDWAWKSLQVRNVTEGRGCRRGGACSFVRGLQVDTPRFWAVLAAHPHCLALALPGWKGGAPTGGGTVSHTPAPRVSVRQVEAGSSHWRVATSTTWIRTLYKGFVQSDLASRPRSRLHGPELRPPAQLSDGRRRQCPVALLSLCRPRIPETGWRTSLRPGCNNLVETRHRLRLFSDSVLLPYGSVLYVHTAYQRLTLMHALTSVVYLCNVCSPHRGKNIGR